MGGLLTRLPIKIILAKSSNVSTGKKFNCSADPGCLPGLTFRKIQLHPKLFPTIHMENFQGTSIIFTDFLQCIMLSEVPLLVHSAF